MKASRETPPKATPLLLRVAALSATRLQLFSEKPESFNDDEIATQVRSCAKLFENELFQLLEDGEIVLHHGETASISKGLKKLRPLWKYLVRATWKTTPRGKIGATSKLTVGGSNTRINIIRDRVETSYCPNWAIAHQVARIRARATHSTHYFVNPSIYIEDKTMWVPVVGADGTISSRQISLTDSRLIALAKTDCYEKGKPLSCDAVARLCKFPSEDPIARGKLCEGLVRLGILLNCCELPFGITQPFSYLVTNGITDPDITFFATVEDKPELRSDRSTILRHAEQLRLNNSTEANLPNTRLVVGDTTVAINGHVSSFFCTHLKRAVTQYVRLSQCLISNANHQGFLQNATKLLQSKFGANEVELSQVARFLYDVNNRDASVLFKQKWSAKTTFSRTLAKYLRETETDAAHVSLDEAWALSNEARVSNELDNALPYEAVVRVGAKSQCDLDSGLFSVAVESIGYPGAKSSRLAYLHGDDIACDAYIRKVQEQNPEALMVELAIETRGPEFNLSRRPPCMDNYLCLWGLRGPQQSNCLGFSDIIVDLSTAGPQLKLRNSGQRVLVFSRTSLIPVGEVLYHFLMNAGSLEKEPVLLEDLIESLFGANRVFTPRVSLQRAILKLARWRLPSSELRIAATQLGCRVKNLPRSERSKRNLLFWKQMQDRYAIPDRTVYRIGNEKKQFLYLGSVFAIDSFVSMLFEHSGDVVFEELFPSIDELWMVDEDDNSYCCELLVQGY